MKTKLPPDARRRISGAKKMLDRTLIKVAPAAYAEFVARLDAPPKPNERLSRTMNAPLPWKND